jgi:hypothetical protein
MSTVSISLQKGIQMCQSIANTVFKKQGHMISIFYFIFMSINSVNRSGAIEKVILMEASTQRRTVTLNSEQIRSVVWEAGQGSNPSVPSEKRMWPYPPRLVLRKVFTCTMLCI